MSIFRVWRGALVPVVAMLIVAGGCATHRASHVSARGVVSAEEDPETTPDQESAADQAGQAGVALVVIGTVVGGVLAPLLLF